MTDLTIGILGFAGLFALLVLRTPVAFAMLLTGFFGIWLLDGLRRAGAVMMTETYSAVSNYSLIVIPMFILLGNVASEAGFSRSLYDAAHAWVGRFRGGLATASVIGCAAFSAVSGLLGGDGRDHRPRRTAGDAPPRIWRRAVNGRDRRRRNARLPHPAFDRLRHLRDPDGGIDWPPFHGGHPARPADDGTVHRGYLDRHAARPAAGPKAGAAPFAERLRLLVRALPLIAVIVVSIGGIYLGVFTPVEASGVGAALVILIAAAAAACRSRASVAPSWIRSGHRRCCTRS